MGAHDKTGRYDRFLNIQKFGGHRVTAVEPDLLDKLYRILRNYGNYQSRLGHIQSSLDSLVKPEGFTEIAFIG